MPLSANNPNAVDNSVVPPASILAVPPTVNIASPSCDTLVFVFDAPFAILSTNFAVSSNDNPNADCVSVIISEALASSIPPLAARLRTFGNIFIDVSASYPASAI